jgi:hypothetical protein
MIPNHRIRLPSKTDQDYVVYFYESGLYQQYRQRQRDALTKPNYGPPSNYDFSSDLPGQSVWSGPQTVEDVIRQGYFAIPKSELETALISDKQHTAKLGLDDVLHQIRHRYEVYEQNIYEIEISKCSVTNSLHNHEAHHGPADSKIEYSVNKRHDELYADQRRERINLWRDISKLKLLLPENAQQYLSNYRKLALLEDSPGDQP